MSARDSVDSAAFGPVSLRTVPEESRRSSVTSTRSNDIHIELDLNDDKSPEESIGNEDTSSPLSSTDMPADVPLTRNRSARNSGKSKRLRDTLSDPHIDRFASELRLSGQKFELNLRALSMYYQSYGETIPVPTTLHSSEIPQPYRKLLFHEKYMTPRLSEFYEREVFLKPLMKKMVGRVLTRCVMLEIDGDSDDPNEMYVVEFGAIHIFLDNIPEVIHEDILAGKKPFGACLVDANIPNKCLPRSFFKIPCDNVLGTLFHVEEMGKSSEENEKLGKVLYGRMNILLNPEDKVMAEVVEILPPQSTIKVEIVPQSPRDMLTRRQSRGKRDNANNATTK
eukprot:TRINITY_DN19726_c0_g1_i1.p1 TRINITY_DN19726_c0_g1~~TRINITY_DN19726_c0_g1_i1.p1  ORF type:complete len:338 (+),score=59.05 TRINITY_DN19726_c0_g1_i1:85-1098(+)